ncbi:Enamine deaminase RidA, house cleaning of reactive enamine intermediates, YjgF/YER057c/UK114 family [Variovorax sp. YR750]|uniref:RidA family protein n=1 Tax=Variovorax sp. YR750 TaxID=1884384 RepID=UPI0008CD8838|nr:RidA family protein [Variovorax sp. YR750]SEM03968.1 Enamine deaminase RidA, house cleaning of reactive enamine intermediates, YjgF/YER057c/UK114 family [Variovorax sp. YR750]
MTDIERKHTNARMSKIVRHGGLVYLCGQTASGSANATGDIAAQTQEVLARIDALLTEAGTNRERILSTTIYLRSIDDFAAMNSIWESWIAQGSAPARTTVEARLASSSLLVEMTVVAAAN